MLIAQISDMPLKGEGESYVGNYVGPQTFR